MSWTELTTRYLEHLGAEGRREGTLERYAAWLELFAGYCQEEQLQELHGLAPVHLHRFHQRLMWTPGSTGRLYAPNTVYQGLRMVRSFIRWAVGIVPFREDPTRGWTLRRPRERTPRLLSGPELERLIQAPDVSTPLGLRDRALLELLCSTDLAEEGCRRLDVADLDLASRTLRVADELEGERRLELGTPLAEALVRYLFEGRPALTRGRDKALFPGRTGGRIGVHHLRNLVRRHARSAGLGSVSVRTLRRARQAQLEAFQKPRFPASPPNREP